MRNASKYIFYVSLLFSLGVHVVGVFGSTLFGHHSDQKPVAHQECVIDIIPMHSSTLPSDYQIAEKKQISQASSSPVAFESIQDSINIANQDVVAQHQDVSTQQLMLEYQNSIKQKIQVAQKYPPWAKKNGIQGNVLVHFFVHSSGAVQRMQILQGSGRSFLNQDALSTIQRAAPFAPIPTLLNCDQVEITVRICYNLENSSIALNE